MLKYITSTKEMNLAVEVLGGKQRLAGDTETYTLPQYEADCGNDGRVSPHTGRVSLLALKSETSVPYVFDLIWLEYNNYDPQVLIALLKQAEYIIFHNARFDLGMLLGQFKFQFTNARCTLTLAQLYANATGSKLARVRKLSLDALCRDWLDVFLTGKGSVQLSQWATAIESRNLENLLWKEKIEYAAKDVDHLFDLHDKLNEVLCSPLPASPHVHRDFDAVGYGYGMAAVVDVEMRFINVVVEMEWNGLPASKQVFDSLLVAVKAERLRAGYAFCTAVKLPTLLLSPFDDYEVPSPDSIKALNSPKQLLRILKELTDLEITSTAGALIERVLKVMQAYADKEEDDDDETPPIEFIDGEDEFYQLLDAVDSVKLDKLAGILRELITYKRLLKLEGMHLGKYINPVTGSIHGRINAIGASTGRSSSSRPNVQQISAKNKIVVELDADVLFASDCDLDSLKFNYK